MLSDSAPTPTKRLKGRPRGSKSEVKPVVVSWRDSLLLNPGDVLKETGVIKRGNLDQCEGETYDVLDAQGLTVGTVEYTATTSMRPPCKTTCWVVQKGIAGNDVVNKRVWL